MKDYYYKQFKDPVLAKKYLNDSIPLSTLTTKDNPHHLEIVTQFRDAKYRKFVNRYHKQYNISVPGLSSNSDAKSSKNTSNRNSKK